MTDLFRPAQPQARQDPYLRVHHCAAPSCGKPNAPCGMMGQWFCWTCAPDDWRAPERRQEAQP